jgi:hypothetical protein
MIDVQHCTIRLPSPAQLASMAVSLQDSEPLATGSTA